MPMTEQEYQEAKLLLHKEQTLSPGEHLRRRSEILEH